MVSSETKLIAVLHCHWFRRYGGIDDRVVQKLVVVLCLCGVLVEGCDDNRISDFYAGTGPALKVVQSHRKIKAGLQLRFSP